MLTLKGISLKRVNNASGLTMIELLVSIIVMTIGILSIAGVVPMAMRQTTKNRIITKALEYSQQEMETLKRMGYDNLALVDTVNSFNPNGDAFYESWVRIADNVGGTAPGLKLSMVRVFTTWHAARPETLMLVSYFSN